MIVELVKKSYKTIVNNSSLLGSIITAFRKRETFSSENKKPAAEQFANSQTPPFSFGRSLSYRKNPVPSRADFELFTIFPLFSGISMVFFTENAPSVPFSFKRYPWQQRRRFPRFCRFCALLPVNFYNILISSATDSLGKNSMD